MADSIDLQVAQFILAMKPEELVEFIGPYIEYEENPHPNDVVDADPAATESGVNYALTHLCVTLSRINS